MQPKKKHTLIYYTRTRTLQQDDGQHQEKSKTSNPSSGYSGGCRVPEIRLCGHYDIIIWRVLLDLDAVPCAQHQQLEEERRGSSSRALKEAR
jgi:hypothetical protein